MSKEPKSGSNSTNGGTAGKFCKCRKTSLMIEAVHIKEKVQAYNDLSKLTKEILTEILVNHDKGNHISAKTVSLTIQGEIYEAYILYAEPAYEEHDTDNLFCKSTAPSYFIAWTRDGVVEFEEGSFTKFIEFNNIDSMNNIDILNYCHCEGNTLNFFTLSGLVDSLINGWISQSFGFSDNRLVGWRKDSEGGLRLCDFLKSAM